LASVSVLRHGQVGRRVSGALALLALAACARDPYVSSVDTKTSGDWRIEQQTDRITGAPLASAMLTTRKVSNAAILFPEPVIMQLLCFRGQPAVLLRFPFKIGSNRNGEFGYRFDEKPGHEPTVRYVDDYKTVAIEDREVVRQFADEMANANVLYVRTRALNAMRSSAEFHVEGAAEAIAHAFASCPLTPGAPAKQAEATPPR